MRDFARILSDLQEWEGRLQRVTMNNHLNERLGFLELIEETPLLQEILAELPPFEVPYSPMYTDAFGRPEWPEACFTTKDQAGYLWAGIQAIKEDKDIRNAGHSIDRKGNILASIRAFYGYVYPPVIRYLRKRLKDRQEQESLANMPIQPLVLSESERQEMVQQYLHSLAFMHPEVLKVSGALIKDGHYRQAILEAHIHLIQQIKAKSGIQDRDGTALIQHAFGTKSPAIRISNHPDEQDGARSLFVGAVMMFRNMPAHIITDHADPHKALEILSCASLLFRLLDEAQVSTGSD